MNKIEQVTAEVTRLQQSNADLQLQLNLRL